MEDYLKKAKPGLISNWSIYSINDMLAVDYVGRYERLQEDLDEISRRLNLPGSIELPKTKSGHRKDRAHYSEVLSEEARRRIEVVCAREIAALGYKWESAV
ncbi:MAG: hypothetical protein F6K21_25195 [Symploca sp. SIO2D2]|nr:hypothetical protein [Symploca sp. SIO2D2]